MKLKMELKMGTEHNQQIPSYAQEQMPVGKIYMDKEELIKNDLTPINLLATKNNGQPTTWQIDEVKEAQIQFFDKDLTTNNYKVVLTKEYEYDVNSNEEDNIINGYLLVPVELDGTTQVYLRDISIPINLNLNLFGRNLLELDSWGFRVVENGNNNATVTIRYNINNYLSENIIWENLKLTLTDLTNSSNNVDSISLYNLMGQESFDLTSRHMYKAEFTYSRKDEDSNAEEDDISVINGNDLWILSTPLFNECFDNGSNNIKNYCKPEEGREKELYDELTTVELDLEVKLTNRLVSQNNNGNDMLYVKFDNTAFNIDVEETIHESFTISEKKFIINSNKEKLYPSNLLSNINVDNFTISSNIDSSPIINVGNKGIDVTITPGLSNNNFSTTTVFHDEYVGQGMLQGKYKFNNLFIPMSEYFEIMKNYCFDVGIFIGKEKENNTIEYYTKTIYDTYSGDTKDNKKPSGNLSIKKFGELSNPLKKLLVGSCSPLSIDSGSNEYSFNYYNNNSQIDANTIHNEGESDSKSPLFVSCVGNFTPEYNALTVVYGIVPNTLYSNENSIKSDIGISEAIHLLFPQPTSNLEENYIINVPEIEKDCYVPNLSGSFTYKYLQNDAITYNVRFSCNNEISYNDISAPNSTVSNDSNIINIYSYGIFKVKFVKEKVININRKISSSSDFIQGVQHQKNYLIKDQYIDYIKRRQMTVSDGSIDCRNIYIYDKQNSIYKKLSNVKGLINRTTNQRFLLFKKNNNNYYIMRDNAVEEREQQSADNPDVRIDLNYNGIYLIDLPTLNSQ